MKTFFLFLVVVACTASTAVAQLDLDQLFTEKSFDAATPPEIRWSQRPGVYFLLEPSELKEGKQLVRVDLKDNSKEVVVPAAWLFPTSTDKPLSIEAFEFSSDETKLLIYTNSKRVWRRNTRGDYWLLDLPSHELKQLGGEAEPSTLMFAKFSPDGSRVAYVCKNNLYVQSLENMQITALTRDGSDTLINGTSDWVNEEELNLRDCFRWSPDSQHLVFWQFDTRDVPVFHMINNTESHYARVISFAYPKVGETNSATRLGVIPAIGGEVVWLQIPGDPREHYLPHAEWTTDGQSLLVEQFNRLQNENRVYQIHPRSGMARLVMTETDETWLENDNPVRWLDEGKSFLWLSERSGWRQLYKASLKDGQLTPITKGEFDVIEVESLDAQGGWLYYSASPENATQRYLFRVKLDGSGDKERLSPQDQSGWHTYQMAKDAPWAVHTYSNYTTPPLVEMIQLETHKPLKTLVDNKALREKLSGLKLPKAEFMKVDIGNGTVLDGWCLMPDGLDRSKKWPLLMHVYGEPHGQTVKDAWGGPRGLWHWMLAQQGCIVASVDNRGTNVPRGRAWRKCVHRQIGVIAPKEQAAALDALLERWPFVDASRVGIWGWSGGGSMSLNAIFRYPEKYHTAIAVAPVPNQLLYDTIYQERYMGLPKDNAEGFRDGSPLTHAHRLQGELLIVHGTGDDNCHYQGVEYLINELIDQGKLFSVLPYPNRSHSISEGSKTARHFWGSLTKHLKDNLKFETNDARESQ